MKVFIGPYPGARSKKERRLSIRIDPFDTWSMDVTLAEIILPMLIQLKATQHGYPNDFYEGDIEKNIPPGEIGGGPEAWAAVLDKMIWSFQEIVDDNYMEKLRDDGYGREWYEKVQAHDEKIQEGLNLFGKFYRALWD